MVGCTVFETHPTRLALCCMWTINPGDDQTDHLRHICWILCSSDTSVCFEKKGLDILDVQNLRSNMKPEEMWEMLWGSTLSHKKAEDPTQMWLQNSIWVLLSRTRFFTPGRQKKAARSETVFKIWCAHDYPHRNEPESTKQPSLMNKQWFRILAPLKLREFASLKSPDKLQ